MVEYNNVYSIFLAKCLGWPNWDLYKIKYSISVNKKRLSIFEIKQNKNDKLIIIIIVRSLIKIVLIRLYLNDTWKFIVFN